MKIRQGFVTNSSSSSFVVAIRQDLTHDEKDVIFEQYCRKSYESMMADYDMDEDDFDKVAAMSALFDHRTLFELNEWKVSTGWASSEDCEGDGAFLYYLPDFETEKFKFASYC